LLRLVVYRDDISQVLLHHIVNNVIRQVFYGVVHGQVGERKIGVFLEEGA